MKEHAKGASLTTQESKKSRFYCAYPSKHHTSGEQDTLSQLQRGWWEDIQFVATVRWGKENSNEVINLFEWDEHTVERLKANRADMTLEKKKERMVVYLFETVLGLCIKESDNVSSNPSFELFNGRFGGGY